MRYRSLVKKIQHDSGFSDVESEIALDTMVESLAVRLPDDELKDFASQLPKELKQLAMSTATGSRDEYHMDIIEEFMEREMISEENAKKQVLSAWTALKSFVTEGQIRHIKSRLSPTSAQMLH